MGQDIGIVMFDCKVWFCDQYPNLKNSPRCFWGGIPKLNRAERGIAVSKFGTCVDALRPVPFYFSLLQYSSYEDNNSSLPNEFKAFFGGSSPTKLVWGTLVPMVILADARSAFLKVHPWKVTGLDGALAATWGSGWISKQRHSQTFFSLLHHHPINKEK